MSGYVVEQRSSTGATVRTGKIASVEVAERLAGELEEGLKRAGYKRRGGYWHKGAEMVEIDTYQEGK